MKRFAFILIFQLVSVSGYSMDKIIIEEWKRTTWRLNIILNNKNVHGGAVQFAIMDHDPRNAFKKDYEKLKEKSIKEKRYDPDAELSLISVSWDIQFRTVKGDEVYLLLNKDTCGFSSNALEQDYFLVTKTIIVNGCPAVWVIPFKAKYGTEQNITLEHRNIILLKKVADKN